MILKERMEEALSSVRNQIYTDVRREDPKVDFFDGTSTDIVVTFGI
jgi:hypothetical protein